VSTHPLDPSAPARDEQSLIAALKRREEGAFVTLVERYHPSLLRVAASFVKRWAEAEEVVQDTWLGVLRGLEGFEGRSSFKTWLFRILVNRARTRARREARSVPFSDLRDDASEDDHPESAVPPDRFRGPDDPYAGHWAVPPQSWGESPEQRLLSKETHGVIAKAIDELPVRQREVITLRDIEGLSSEEVCNVLELSDSNQRVLLHRARSRVRSVLERYFAPERG